MEGTVHFVHFFTNFFGSYLIPVLMMSVLDFIEYLPDSLYDSKVGEWFLTVVTVIFGGIGTTLLFLLPIIGAIGVVVHAIRKTIIEFRNRNWLSWFPGAIYSTALAVVSLLVVAYFPIAFFAVGWLSVYADIENPGTFGNILLSYTHWVDGRFAELFGEIDKLIGPDPEIIG